MKIFILIIRVIYLSIFAGCISIAFSSCALKTHKKKTYELPVTKMKIGSIVLEPHQAAPIEYLLKHPQQKGLLLAHYLGTGKTFTALGFAEMMGEKQVIILGPETLRSNWQYHMGRMGLKNPARYKFFSFEEALTKLEQESLKNSILIIDEIHHFVGLIKSGSKKMRSEYAALYKKLNNSERILALSGTPIFADVSDLSYILNLVSGQEFLPFNERDFLDQYTKIEKNRSFWRGHLTESHTLLFTLPFVFAAIPLAFIAPSIGVVSALYFGGLGVGFLSFPLINSYLSLDVYPLRSFDAVKLKDISSKYVSYFDFRENKVLSQNYPTKKIYEQHVSYNEKQIEFFLEYADMALNKNQLARILQEKRYEISGELIIESSSLQTELRTIAGNGREIGNFHFENEQKNLIEAPKFEAVYQHIQKKPHGVVVYSSFYENGIKLFAEFLDRKGLKNSYRVLHPDMPISGQMAMINEYNTGKFDILLLHPNFAEGISLEGTQTLHILEPLGSQAISEQVIGRTIRLNSHARLDKQYRHVDVYMWESTLSGLQAFLAKNNNWALRFNELNSIASFGAGQGRIDANHFMKARSPDEFASQKGFFISNAMTSLKNLFSQYSIEGIEND